MPYLYLPACHSKSSSLAGGSSPVMSMPWVFCMYCLNHSSNCSCDWVICSRYDRQISHWRILNPGHLLGYAHAPAGFLVFAAAGFQCFITRTPDSLGLTWQDPFLLSVQRRYLRQFVRCASKGPESRRTPAGWCETRASKRGYDAGPSVEATLLTGHRVVVNHL
jgi:hypothetical protein